MRRFQRWLHWRRTKREMRGRWWWSHYEHDLLRLIDPQGCERELLGDDAQRGFQAILAAGGDEPEARVVRLLWVAQVWRDFALQNCGVAGIDAVRRTLDDLEQAT